MEGISSKISAQACELANAADLMLQDRGGQLGVAVLSVFDRYAHTARWQP